MKKLRYLAFAGLLLTAGAAMAVPAKRITFTATQPDGSQVTLTRAGDEFNKYFLTDDGQIVVGSESGGYYFAEVEASTGRMVASKVVASDLSARNAEQTAFVASVDKGQLEKAMLKNAEMSPLSVANVNRTALRRSKANLPAQSGIGLFPGTTFPAKGSTKGLIILVQYSDVKFNTSYNAGDYFRRLASQKGFSDYGATGSALDWFTDASNGQFTPSFDVYGPVTLPNKQSYYGSNDAYGNDMYPEQMVIDGCKLLDSQINFKDYDTDGDGYVDNVFVFYAGQGEASGGSDNTVWPHQWDIESAGKTLTLDNVKISRYACSNEWDGSKPDGIGTFVHEFSHVMGLPDLYHTSSNSAYYTPGEWSVMDYGPYNNDGRTPPTYSIFERNAFGWIDPMVLDQTPREVELSHILKSNEGCIIPTSSDNEFFLLENRQQSGWDAYLPGHGMLIWHIDYNASVWTNNSVNNTKSHQYVDIEEANNKPTSTSPTAVRDWAFPGTSGTYTSFTDDTTPGMKTWKGAKLGIPLTEIAENNGTITFNVCGGKPAIETPVANQTEQNEIGGDYFIASWNEVPGATDYLLSVYTKGDVVATTETCDFGSDSTPSLPDGWNFNTSLAGYSTSGNYGAAKPSLKMSVIGHALTTPRFENPITKISFWSKGQNLSNSTLSIYAVDGTTETKLTDLSEWDKNNVVQVDYTVESPDVHQLKLVYNKSAGNLAIDDIVISTSSAGSSVLPAYNELSTKGATSVRVDNLPSDQTQFSYTVRAVNENGVKSAPSKTVDVELKSAGVEGIEADDADMPVEYYNLQGIKVTNPGKGIFIRRQGSKVEKVTLSR